MLFTAIDHPAICCQDVQKLADWYCQHLGMRVIAGNGATPPAFMLGYGNDLRTGTTLELMPFRNEGPAPAETARFAPGIRHFAVRVTDFEQAYAQLKEAGIPFVSEPVTAVGGGKIVSFRDPEGNEVQIVQR